MNAIVKTAKNFVKSADFVNGIISSTKAGFGGSGYSVELFNDGHWRVMWDNQVGNLYISPGMIVRLPQCSDNSDTDKQAAESAGVCFEWAADFFGWEKR